VVAATCLGAGGPVLRATNGDGASAGLLAIALVAAAYGTAVATARWRNGSLGFRVSAAVIAAIVVAVAYDRGHVQPFVVVALNTALAVGALVSWPPFGPRRALPRAPLAVGPVLAAGIDWYRSPSPRTELALAVVALAVLEAATRWPVVMRVFDRLVAAIVLLVRDVVTFAVWFVALLPVWIAGSITRSRRLLDGRRTAPSNWATSRRAPAGSESRTLGLDPATTGSRRARVLPRVVLAVLLVGVPFAGFVLLRSDSDPAVEDPDDDAAEVVPFSTYAHEDEPWAEALFAELQQAGNRVDRILGSRKVDEFRGRYVNIRDSRRVSYEPDDPELTVWFFGGSTMYGVGQRDGHTVPSVVARAAERDGIRLRVVNFGMEAATNWTETILFAEALTGTDDPPDLVVFYDGANDQSVGWQRAIRGNRRPDETSRMPLSDLEEWDFEHSGADEQSLLSDEASMTLRVELAARQYGRGVDVARRLAESYDIPVVHFWQPIPESKPVTPADAELYRTLQRDPADQPEQARIYDEIRIRSGADPVDLSGAFDDVDVPVFFDQSHTNEYGARLVGDAVFDRLLPTLRRLGGGS